MESNHKIIQVNFNISKCVNLMIINNSNKILRHCCRHIKTNFIFQGHMMMKAGHMHWFNTDLNLFIYIDERKLLLLHISQHDLQDCCCR